MSPRVRLAPTPFQPGARAGGETLTSIPADAVIRPLRDWLVVEAEAHVASRLIYVPEFGRPLKGTVLAVGPGCYPKRYDHAEKHKRSKSWDSRRFRPTEVKVGDRVELGGAESGGYAFEQLWWGERLCLLCREEDVCLVREA